jgi:hypothetical protein
MIAVRGIYSCPINHVDMPHHLILTCAGHFGPTQYFIVYFYCTNRYPTVTVLIGHVLVLISVVRGIYSCPMNHLDM